MPISPRPDQVKALLESDLEGPVAMLNLLKFKDKAEYADGRDSDLTGRQAYQLYGMGVAGLLPDYGGRVFFMADTTFLSLGEVDELWDEVAIAVYPDRNALFRMSSSQEWQDLAVHREAGLKGQLNIESVMPKNMQALPWMDLFLKEMAQ